MARTAVSIISTLARCGPVNMLKGIITHLDSEKYRPVVVTLSPEGENSCIRDFESAGVYVKQLNMSRVGSLLMGRGALEVALDSIGADVVHCHGFRADFLVASGPVRHPVVSTVHSDLLFDYRLSFGQLAGGFMAKREYAALRNADVVVAVSEASAGRAVEFGLKPAVIRNGVDLNVYYPPSDSTEVKRTREILGWPEERFVVLHTGVLINRKRPLEVVRAFQKSKLSKKGMLVFAGDGPLLACCREAAAGWPDVLFLGHRADIPELLRGADAVVSNSTVEGLPMALLEACACGLRVLASDIDAHRSLAKLFAEQVALFPVEDGHALTDQLNALSQCRRGSPIQPLASSLQTISAVRMSRLYQDLYDKVMSGTEAITEQQGKVAEQLCTVI